MEYPDTQDSVKIVALSGRLDSYTIPNARKMLDDALKEPSSGIIVNMQSVTFVDSTALSALVQTFKRSREQNKNLRLCCLQQPVRMIFELTRLDKVFEIFPTQQEALEAFIE